MRELVEHHVSGQLRVAPEHVSDQVLKYMGKPSHSVYQQFLKEYDAANRQTGKQQYAVPYFMSSHPGCTMKEAVKLAEYVRDLGFTPEQVQDFYQPRLLFLPVCTIRESILLQVRRYMCRRTPMKKQYREL